MGTAAGRPPDETARFSDELEQWLTRGEDTTVGGLVDLFEERSFAVLFVVLMSPAALPLPTGGATHVFEIITALGALQLLAGRESVWIPDRWRTVRLGGKAATDGTDDAAATAGASGGAAGAAGRVLAVLLRVIRWLERFSRPRMPYLFSGRFSGAVFGLLVLAGTAGAFFAPPFSGLDTLPALGVVLLSLGVLQRDVVVAAAGIVVGIAGGVVEIVLGKAVIDWVRGLF